MADYLFIIRGGDAAKAKLSPEQLQQHMQRWMTWIDQMSQKGIFKAGEPLDEKGKTIRGKKQVLTDGPYAESKDLVGGYLIIQAASLAKATEIARDCPCYDLDGSCEIREIRELKV
ncbi:MAG TPA: YciI family protein [Planctomycetota bacterium]|nr:YciI family protein [Planctomycetota bacterium]